VWHECGKSGKRCVQGRSGLSLPIGPCGVHCGKSGKSGKRVRRQSEEEQGVIHHQVPSQMACHPDGEAYVFGDEADTRRQTKLCLVCDLCGIRPGEEHDTTRSALGSFRHDEVVR